MITRAALFGLCAVLLLAVPARAAGLNANATPATGDNATANVLANTAQHFAVHKNASAPMAQQIAKSLNNDENEGVQKLGGPAKANTLFNRRRQAQVQKIYNRNDDDLITSGTPVRRAFTGPHSAANSAKASASYND